MRGHVLQKYRQLQTFYQERGLPQLLLRIARGLFSSLYNRQVQYITMRNLESRDAGEPINTAGENLKLECLVVDSLEALPAVEQEIPASFRDSVDDLKRKLAQGYVVVLGRRPKEEGTGKEVVGYYLCEQGVFSALGRKKHLSSDIVFGHYMEVLPKYRGQRISELINATRDEYFRRKGFKKRCGVISPQNHSSLRASRRKGSIIVGTVQRISILRGLFVWETPWRSIERALGVVGGDSEGRSVVSSRESMRDSALPR